MQLMAKRQHTMKSGIRRQDSKLSTQSFNQFSNFQMDNHRVNIVERMSENSGSSESYRSNSKDNSMRDHKRKSALAKLTLYQQSWKRMDKNFNKTAYPDGPQG